MRSRGSGHLCVESSFLEVFCEILLKLCMSFFAKKAEQNPIKKNSENAYSNKDETRTFGLGIGNQLFTLLRAHRVPSIKVEI